MDVNRPRAGVRRGARRIGLALVTLAAALTLLPAAPSGAVTAVDVKVGTLTGLTAATASPGGNGVLATSAPTGTATAPVAAQLYEISYDGANASVYTGARLANVAAPRFLAAAGTSVLAVEGSATSTSWSADLVTGWPTANAAAKVILPSGLSGGPVAAAAAGGYGYIELSSGQIVSVSLTTGSAQLAGAVTTPVLAGSAAATQTGVLAISPDGQRLYVGATVAGAGVVQAFALGGGTASGPAMITLTATMTPTALFADGSSIYVAGSAGLGLAGLGATSVPIAAYPVTGMGCGSLSIDRVGTQSYLDCGAAVGSTDAHLYRFTVPAAASDGLREAAGVPLTKAATGVWGTTAGAVYAFEAGVLYYVGQSALSTQPALKTYPQPPSNVVAAPISTTDNGSSSTGYGIWVSWTPPVIGFGDVTGYTVSAKPASGNASYCSNITSGTTTECLIPGLVPGTPYTVSVQSVSAAGASAAVLVPYKVNAGTPGPTISNTGGCSASAGIVVPTYTLAKSGGTLAAPAVTVSWPGISDTSCDPFTHQTITMGAHPVTYYVVSAIDTATGATAKTVNVPVGTATTATSPAPNAGVSEYQGTITGLTAGKSYVFTVAANDSTGTPSATTGLVPFSASWTGTATYAVPDTATPSGGSGGASPRVMDTTAPDASGRSTATYVPGGVLPATYLSQVALYGSAYYGAMPVDPSLLASAPTPPWGVSATTTSGTIVASWKPQANYSDHLGWGLQDVVGYTATASYTDPTGKSTTKTCTTTGYLVTSCTITGLTNGLTYSVTLQARSGVLGPQTTYDTGVSPSGVPGAPSGLSVTVPQISPNAANQQWGTAVVKWTPPTDNGGQPITGYEIVATPSDTTIANTFTEYLCDPNDTGATGAQSVIDAQIAATPSLQAPVTSTPPALPISANQVGHAYGDIFPDACEANTWGTNSYTFPIGSLSSQTTWSFKVAAHNGYQAATSPTATWGTLSTASGKVTPTGAPMPPTKVTATVTATAITAKWTAPTASGGWAFKGYQATLYEYDSVGNANPVGTCTASAAQTTCSVYQTSHTPDGGSYFFTVQATNNGYGQAGPIGTLPASNESALSNTVSWYAVPPALTVTGATPDDKSILVAWDPLPRTGTLDSSNSPIFVYTASATAGVTTKTCTAAPPATSCTITGLTNGTAYTVGVTEANPAATSLPGYWKDPNDLSAAPTTPVRPGTVPDAPTGVTAHPSNHAADVWWTAPKNTGGVGVDYYTVSIVPGGAQCLAVQASGPLTCHLEGLANGIAYSATVTAHGAFGSSVASTPSASFVPYGLAQPPVNVQAFSGDRRVTVTWEAPDDNGGAAITGYQVTARPLRSGSGALGTCSTAAPTSTTKSGTTTITTPTGPAPLTCTVTGLTNGADYIVDVASVNAAGTSSRSGPSSPFTPLGAPDAPTGAFAYTDPGSVKATGPMTLHVAWNPSVNDGGSPIVQYTATANNGSTCVAYAGQTQCDIAGLRQGLKYTVTITATNLDGYVSAPSKPSAPSIPAGPPSVPTNVQAAAAQNAITVSWTAAHGNGLAVSQYVVTVRPTGQVVLVAGSRTSVVISKLDPAVGYQVTVQAQSGPVLVSGMSKLSNRVHPYTIPSRMAKPRAKAVRTRNGYKVIVGWTAPAASGTPISGYIVRRNGGGAITVRARRHRVVFKGLARNHRYSFTVTPMNKYGTGQTSLPVVVQTHG